jgi:2-polyprenyl-6-hydroxyphenyl methylase/3-demethylubiquinone-9 3-methyltransferase
MSESRFAFGENWKAFLDTVDEARQAEARRSLVGLLDLDASSPHPLAGKSFLDIGSGSGLFSLAAWQLGARVTSIDYDAESVGCTEQLKKAFHTGDRVWSVHEASVLDERFMHSLGSFDVVYSWGVLHHTGEMWRAIELARQRVADGGIFAIAIYNDQGGASRRWHAIKTIYHRLPGLLRPLWVLLIAGIYELKFALARSLRGRNPLPFADWKKKKQDRGMSVWHDWVDWIGGMPFEVARPEQIIVPAAREGFQLIALTTVMGGWGCNEYVFRRLKN